MDSSFVSPLLLGESLVALVLFSLLQLCHVCLSVLDIRFSFQNNSSVYFVNAGNGISCLPEKGHNISCGYHKIF